MNQNNSKESKDVFQVYEQIAAEYSDTVKSDDLDHRYIGEFLALFTPGKKILDIGAGTGVLSAEMKENHQLDVTAVDFSREMIKIAEKNHPDLKILQMDLRDLHFPESTFDGVFANYSFIHIQENEVALSLAGVARVLKQGGYLYLALQEPVTAMDKDGYYPVAYRPEMKMFINLFTEKEISNYLLGAGFRILNVQRRSPDKETEFPFNKLFVVAQKI